MNQGEIWLVDFAAQVGQEIGKRRPALIVSNNSVGRLPLKIVVPITTPSAGKQSWHVPLTPDGTNGLTKVCTADCLQIISISQNRFLNQKPLGVLSAVDMDEVKLCLAKVLDLL